MILAPSASLPDYAVPSGGFIQEWMDDHDITTAELARRLDVPRTHVSKLLRGKVALSCDMALRLARVTGVPARTWNSIDAQFHDDRARLAANTPHDTVAARG